ncbi:hypothetical protein V5799_010881 [Amblyomma americanum]|uniref:Uncharacterized protein n=1 Tax=Amblyomma americanum TaxID=6943 RepID=A0AAQ4EIK7_AMBAM
MNQSSEHRVKRRREWRDTPPPPVNKALFPPSIPRTVRRNHQTSVFGYGYIILTLCILMDTNFLHLFLIAAVA